MTIWAACRLGTGCKGGAVIASINYAYDVAMFPRPSLSALASNRGFLPPSSDVYLASLDWTGRQVHSDRRGAGAGAIAANS